MSSKKINPWRPSFEMLENREMMAASQSASFGNGVLKIQGTDSADKITLRQQSGRISVDGIRIKSSTSNLASVSATSVKQIVVNGHGGDDNINLNSGSVSGQQAILAPAKIYGGEGHDTLVGGNGKDVLSGWTGSDRLHGGVGHDSLTGGEHDDYLNGQAGNDRLYGLAGRDSLHGDEGNDTLHGGADSDLLFGEGGTDTFRRTQYMSNIIFEGLDDDWADVDPYIAGGDINEIVREDSPWHINQFGSPTCAFLASLAGTANWTSGSKDLVQKIQYNSTSDTYGIRLFVGGSWKTTWVNGDWTEGMDPGGPLWVTLYQKAFLKAMDVNYQNSDGSYRPHDQWYSMTGQKWNIAGNALTTLTGYSKPFTATAAMSAATMRDQMAGGWVLVASSLKNVPSSKVVPGHAYWVRSVSSNGQVTLYNPWAIDTDSSGTVVGANDGLVTLSWGEFTDNFAGYGRG
jgi:hypothetical protein